VFSLPRLHVIVNVAPGFPDPVRLVTAALAGGAPLIQLRPKQVDDMLAYSVGCQVASLCADAGVPLIMNDRPDIALAVGASGVHVGVTDLPVPVVSWVMKDMAMVGGTCRDVSTAQAHERAGAAYLGVGPVYDTDTKIDLPSSIGPKGIAEIVAATKLPVIAIAGISVQRVAEVMAAGAHGIAILGAVAMADDPAEATAAFMNAITQATT
jgi:thiamine-phosphate pyrophosphorylase